MTEKDTEATDLTTEENQSLARLLFVSSANPIGKDSSDEERVIRQDAWVAEKPKFMAQARRMARLLNSDKFDITLTFNKPAG